MLKHLIRAWLFGTDPVVEARRMPGPPPPDVMARTPCGCGKHTDAEHDRMRHETAAYVHDVPHDPHHPGHHPDCPKVRYRILQHRALLTGQWVATVWDGMSAVLLAAFMAPSGEEALMQAQRWVGEQDLGAVANAVHSYPL